MIFQAYRKRKLLEQIAAEDTEVDTLQAVVDSIARDTPGVYITRIITHRRRLAILKTRLELKFNTEKL